MKTNKGRTYGVRVDEELEQAIDAACAEYGLSISELVRDAIYKYTKNRETYHRFELWHVLLEFISRNKLENADGFTHCVLEKFTTQKEVEGFLNLPFDVQRVSLEQFWSEFSKSNKVSFNDAVRQAAKRRGGRIL